MSEITFQQKNPRKPALVDATAMRSALRDSFLKLSPRHLVKSPVMAIVLLGTVLSAIITRSAFTRRATFSMSTIV